jgi:hypothetical protein
MSREDNLGTDRRIGNKIRLAIHIKQDMPNARQAEDRDHRRNTVPRK